MTHETSRRQFLQSASAATVGSVFVSFGQSSLSAELLAASFAKKKGVSVANQQIPIVDTHHHLWDLGKFTLPWMVGNDAVKAINRNFVMSDYFEATEGLNIAKTVYMEVNVDSAQQEKEAKHVIGLCKRDDNPMVAAVIGGSPQSSEFASYIKKFADSEYVKGVRTVLHDADRKKGMCLEAQFVENMNLLGKLGFSYDLCMRPEEIGDGAALIRKCPKTRFIIDHCGNMPVVVPESGDELAAYKKQRTAWMTGMKAAAAEENSVCKISGIVVTAEKGKWQANDLAENINFCLETFGDDRVFFGGDWPVCTLKATFKQWVSALQEIVKDRPVEFQKKLFHDNAVKFYGLS